METCEIRRLPLHIVQDFVVQTCATNVRQVCTWQQLRRRSSPTSPVATARQVRSGLGLEAQRKTVDDFLASRAATLVIAKLDRLSRNAAFLLSLQASGVHFLAVDMPEANDLTVGIMAPVAQQVREAISRRTKEALAAAKARGVRLGNPNGAAALRRADKGGVALQAAVRANADAFAADLAPVLKAITGEGLTPLRAIAAELNRRGIQTRRGGKWHVSTVRYLPARLEGH
ncbi:recombinase family protein [Sedimentitalea sp. HM32M-2]|uniref:recombinase family protein n=1 Tax=Sedimentitalea sp. HM32M-2 TaxID=3351566 RepID=UPI00362CF919